MGSSAIGVHLPVTTPRKVDGTAVQQLPSAAPCWCATSESNDEKLAE